MSRIKFSAHVNSTTIFASDVRATHASPRSRKIDAYLFYAVWKAVAQPLGKLAAYDDQQPKCQFHDLQTPLASREAKCA